MKNSEQDTITKEESLIEINKIAEDNFINPFQLLGLNKHKIPELKNKLIDAAGNSFKRYAEKYNLSHTELRTIFENGVSNLNHNEHSEIIKKITIII